MDIESLFSLILVNGFTGESQLMGGPWNTDGRHSVFSVQFRVFALSVSGMLSIVKCWGHRGESMLVLNKVVS